uniref:S-adenosyl-L-methionine:salicylic acid carboxyl methyltransferase n=1 Tax=Oryza sativa subsp. japonica TaxID=39947 RepID=Q8RV71_ORYSJ|nr:Putative S-adenosyl-L-methionine:salicylic acid carboxyl methyltransferase [Oryza sativa Japonica Group]
MKPLIEAAVVDMFEAGLPARFGVADLDCASGPNALALISTAINAVHHHLLGPAPAAASRCDELTVLLNDLPTNDFTSAMTGLPLLRQKHSVVGSGVDYWPGVFVSVVPGTFYGRLFPERTMHLVCSSFSLHWLSKSRLVTPTGTKDLSLVPVGIVAESTRHLRDRGGGDGQPYLFTSSSTNIISSSHLFLFLLLSSNSSPSLPHHPFLFLLSNFSSNSSPSLPIIPPLTPLLPSPSSH